jgi:hypothetical protein
MAWAHFASCQPYNAAYVHNLFAKYPTVKSDLCPGCKEFDNPYYKSIGDTCSNTPVNTFYIYTKEHQDLQIAADKAKIFKRAGIFADWHPVTGQPELSGIYSAANDSINSSINKLVYGHCIAWITLAWCQDAVIFSDIEAFNEAMEFQGQNIGTEIATENICRKLLSDNVTDSVLIWAGTFGNQGSFTNGKATVVIPKYYWKIISYFDIKKGEQVETCWLLPNLVTEIQSKLPDRVSNYKELVDSLRFEPKKIFN